MSYWAFAVALPCAAVLVAYTLRRAVFLAGALAAGRPPAEAGALPSVTLLVPALDEGEAVVRMLTALERLDYPAGLLTIVLVNDGSTDGTGQHFQAWASGHGATVVDLPSPHGKFAALNEALGHAPVTAVLAVCDADLSPRPDWLRHLVAPFADPTVGAVAGYLAPANANSGPIARYAAVESWVHQLITSAAKDRLGLDPPTLGACAYRRLAFEQAGRFGDAPSGEDVRTGAALTRAGWRTRFVRGAVTENLVVHNARDYWHQHIRWARNLFSSARPQPHAGARVQVGTGRRLERWLSAAGYADRLAFVAVAAFALTGTLPLWLPAVYVAVAGAEVVVAVVKGGAGRSLPQFLASVVAVFALDVCASAVALAAQALDRPRTWRRSFRDLRGGATDPRDG